MRQGTRKLQPKLQPEPKVSLDGIRHGLDIGFLSSWFWLLRVN